MTYSPLPLILASAAFLAPLTHAQVSVYTVATTSGTGADFSSLQAAIDSVPSGSLLILGPGDHQGADLIGKGISLVADGGGEDVIVDWIEVRDLPASDVVRVRGITQPGGFFKAGLSVKDSLGEVWVEDSELRGLLATSDVGIHTVRIENSRRVALVRTVSLPGYGYFGEPGLGAQILGDASATFYECELSGAGGGNYWCDSASAGLLVASGSTAHVFDGRVVGGDCYDYYFGPALSPAVSLGVGSELTLRNVAIEPGEAMGQVAEPIGGETQAIVSVMETQLRGVEVPALVDGGEGLAVRIYGSGGDRVLLGYSSRPETLFFSGLFSSMSLVAPQLFGSVVELPESGELTLDAVAPGVQPGLALEVYTQGYHVLADSAGGPDVLLGTPSSMTVARAATD